MKVKMYRYLILLVAVILCFWGCKKTDSAEIIVGDKSREEEADRSKESKATMKGLGEYEIAFSETGALYSATLQLEVLSKQPCKIYYTTDGKDPDENQKLYEKAIELTATSNLKVACIKAKGYFEDGTVSDTIIHTYYLSTQIEKRFSTMVFSVTTDPYNLYDYEYGIFVEGKLRDDYIKNNPQDKIEPNDPANYNLRGAESEREIYLEIMQPDGTVIAEQAAGVRTYGGWSRANLQKSMKIFARKEYDEENNKIRYEFFPDKTAANGSGTILDSFKQLVLRNCGNDNGFAFIRDELFQTLAGQAGFQDYEAVRPVTLFINGTYQGFYWLHEVYGDEYFEDNYGKYKGDFQILEGGELYKNADETGENAQAIVDYDKMYAFSAMDLTDNATYEKLCEQMDVENYLSYYALQIYLGNEDWPHNNYKTYRYYATEGEVYREAPFDGKWRYLPHDMDFTFAIYGTGAEIDNIGYYVGENGEFTDTCPLFGQLMKREDCKEIFITKTLDLINGAFAPDHLKDVLDSMNASRLSELQNMYDKNLLEDWVEYNQLPYQLSVIKEYGAKRASHIVTKYQEYFGMGDRYQLIVAPAVGGKVKVNSFLTEDHFIGNYYSNYNTTITAVVPKGKKFDYWLVNGGEVETKELVITPDMIVDGKVEVNCIMK